MNTAQKPTHYFVYTGHGTQTKNILQAKFKDYLETLNGTLVNAENLQGLKKQIIDKSVELNGIHSRCTALKISFEECYSKTGLRISGFYFLTFNILKAYHASN